MSNRLKSEANITIFYLGFDIMAKRELVVFLDHQIFTCFNSKMPS